MSRVRRCWSLPSRCRFWWCSSWAFRFQRRIQSETENRAGRAGRRHYCRRSTHERHRDGYPHPPGPSSLQPVVTAVFNSLAALESWPNANKGNCSPPGNVTGPVLLKWITLCPDVPMIWSSPLTWKVITSTSPAVVGTIVTVTYPYHWRFNSVIQLLSPAQAMQRPRS